MSSPFESRRRAAAPWLVALALLLPVSRLHAQAPASPEPDPEVSIPSASPVETNAGRLSISAGVDVLSSYMFRGIRQDDRGMIGWPAVDLGVAVFKGDGVLRTVGLNLGLWNSLHSGPTGSSGPSGKVWYESDFYSTLTFGLAGGVSLGATYTAYVSPNASFRTVKEMGFSVAIDDSRSPLPMAPYGLVAVELEGQADGGISSGTYLELGVKPRLAALTDHLSVTFPVKVGLSLNDYYEGPDGSTTFGYVEAGTATTVPLTFVPRSFGTWSARGGLSVMGLGDSLRTLNGGRRWKVVGLVGLGLSY